MRAPWVESGETTLASLSGEMAHIMNANLDDKIVVASLSAAVSPVLGVDFPNLSYVAAFVGKRGEAAPQLVSRNAGAKHVFEVGSSMCVRHGRRCHLEEGVTVDLLVADRVVDIEMLAKTISKVDPRVVAILAAGAHVTNDRLIKELGPHWEVSSMSSAPGNLGLPLCGTIHFQFLRRPGLVDPFPYVCVFMPETVVPMENLLKSVSPLLEKGWETLPAKKGKKPEPEDDQKRVVAEVAENMRLPGRAADPVPHSFPFSVWAQLSAARKRRAAMLLLWLAHSKNGGSACCDLDAEFGPIFMDAALPDTPGLKMFISRAAGGFSVKILTPCLILAVRGYVRPGRINLSTLGPAAAQRAAENATPAAAATAAILAAMRVKSKKRDGPGAAAATAATLAAMRTQNKM